MDWDLALSIVGRDSEVVDYYAKLLRSEFRPDTFVDIGANYGTHTALFVSAGVQCVAFEPNEFCNDYLRRLMEMNHFVAFRLEPIALSETEGEAQLTFPTADTWLGTLKEDRSDFVGADSELIAVRAPVRRLDDIVIPGRRCCVKMDVQGSELGAICGVRTFLTSRCDFFVFEAETEAERKDLLPEITSIGFSIERLSLDDLRSS